MLARFFIDRPIFAWVLSIVIVFAGIICNYILPIAQYPDIAPPTVQVTCVYPGASAVDVQNSVAAPIEQQVVGVERALYMASQSASDGSYTLTVTFELGTDLNMAQVLVQNRVAQALPQLPDIVQQTGVTTKKKSPNILLAVALFAEGKSPTEPPPFNQLYISNYATIQVRDELARLEGVGDVTILGQQDYSIRVWLNPDQLASRELTGGDVVKALQEQNVQVAAGQVGQPPVPAGLDFQLTMTTLGRLTEPEQFAEIVIKTGDGGKITRLKDIGRVELGAKNMNTTCRLDSLPAASLAVWQLPGSNALDTADRVRARMKELQPRFPEGLKFRIDYDTTPFIRESVAEVFKTLRDAVILVAIVVLLFLQDWKALVLPLIDVGVSLVGTLAVLALMGFSLNNLTLFGLVLAIGIVVDDAIVVLENIERWIGMGYKVREATIRAMDEITGPIIAITLVLSSVFLPSAFLGGITGQFFRQFALTIAASMVISAINAMTMTPARATSVFRDPVPGEHHDHREALPWWGIMFLAGLLTLWIGETFFGGLFGMGGGDHGHGEAGETTSSLRLWSLRAMLLVPGLIIGFALAQPVNKSLKVAFGGFNKVFDWITNGYGVLVKGMVRTAVIVLFVYGGLLVLTGIGFTKIPTGFIPNQDKGYLLLDVQLADAAALERTDDVMKQVEKIVLETPGVGHILDVSGQSFILNAISSNYGGGFIILKPFHDRNGHAEGADAVAAELRKRLSTIADARISIFGAPPVDGLGNASGFKLMVEDRGNIGLEALQAQADKLADEARKMPGMLVVFNSFRANTPQLYIDVDRVKCKSMGVELKQVFDALQIYMGSVYVNDINNFGRTWQVNVQASAEFRVDADTVRRLKVLNREGHAVPIGSVATIQDTTGPVLINRFNTYPAAVVNGVNSPLVSTGDVLKNMEALSARELPNSMVPEWTEISFLQRQASRIVKIQDLRNSPITALIGAVVLVYLILAAQYESWTLPWTILLVVPMCVLCALIGIFIARMDMNIFVQIGFVVLVGLACKNAILVVEFAKERMEKDGLSLFDATIEASKVRLRPIVMTSFAFILGVVPLMLGHGAGAEMRRTLGVAVFSGMLGVTMFGIFLTPIFFYVIQWLVGAKSGTKKTEATTEDAAPPHP
ncbi:efflux RND transporter permease subunit [Anatilimnocola floriformis]|uniref:efflux RND transporter permease subunit n=1 Tax=Anatilimnocola floriformis TaxID=2948575 RepID=UPI0020C4C6AF|nr:efflux RND transporter permease subunit [Anatilimnocola floriformis]